MFVKRGVHPSSCKLSCNCPVELAKLPSKIILPLSQHIGASCDPLVKPGDAVKTGQKIAESKSAVSACIHSSISGTVKSIEKLAHPITGKPVKSIIIESDGKDTKATMNKRDYLSFTKEQLLDIIKEAGIVGLGGAAFPTHVKLNPPKEKNVDTLIINGAECEPYITADHRLMLEKADELLEGVDIIRKILNPIHIYIAIEKNKKDAIKLLKARSKFNEFKIIPLKTVYPQGGEKQLIYSVTKRIVPDKGLPMDVGCIVQNVATVFAVYEAVAFSKPLYERIVTISGRVNTPKNILARNGTLVSELIQQAGGYSGNTAKLINGGPMMGVALHDDALPIVKATNAIIAFNSEDIHVGRNLECIRCGKCLEACPMNLNPTLIAKSAEKEKYDISEKAFAMSCIECGCCAYKCPCRIPLVHWIRFAKAEIGKKA